MVQIVLRWCFRVFDFAEKDLGDDVALVPALQLVQVPLRARPYNKSVSATRRTMHGSYAKDSTSTPGPPTRRVIPACQYPGHVPTRVLIQQHGMCLRGAHTTTRYVPMRRSIPGSVLRAVLAAPGSPIPLLVLVCAVQIVAPYPALVLAGAVRIEAACGINSAA